VLSLLRQLGPGKIRGKQDYVGICNEQVDIIRNALPLACAACAALADRDSIDAVYEVLERLHRTYLAMKRERGLLTFGDIAHMARDILLHNGHVRSYFQRKFRYIMVDEFQDTNRLQKDLVYLLAQDPLVRVEGIPDASQLDRKKLFFVGDEKQSIYRFRGADVSVFKQLDKEITASGGRRIVLETNYRSEPLLIDLLNTLFARIMGDASLAYEATFQPLLSREAYPFIRSRIGLMYKPKAQDPTPAEDDEEEEALDVQAEAYAIANLINRMTSSDEYLVPDRNGGIRRPHHEDIAVLFRTSANQMHYEKALRIAGIPYRLSAIQSLFLEAPANDLYLFLQLVVHPDDKLAFAGVMRSPFCRLSDDVLPLVLERMEEGFPAVEDLLPDDAQRLAYAQCTEVYDRLCRLSGTASVAELVSLLWHEGGYRYHLLSDPLFHVYLEHYDYLLELAIGFDGRNLGLADFLDFLRPRLGQRENLSDIEPLRASEHGVRIMTIHKSKGLEFPIVILASMGSAPKHMTTPAWYDAPQGEDAIPVPRHMQPYGTVGNILFERDKEMLLGMERAEMKRLFYVALTRAQTHLILSGCVNAQNMGEKSADRNFLALFEHHTGIIADHQALGSNFQVDIIERAPVSILRASVEQSVVDARVETMAACYGTPAPRRIVVPSSVAVTAISHGGQEVGAGAAQRLPGIASDTIIEREGLGKAFGTWCHAIVELALAASQEASLDAAAQHAMPIEIRRSSLSRQELGVLTSDATALADGFLSSRAFAALRERHPCSIESEVGFSMRLDEDRGVVANGSIDVLLRYEDHVRIIDFKTDLLRVPQIHARQLELYREAARRLYGLPVFSAICYLRDAERLEWIAGA
jgi:ATP-dependent exoDNAse (exonuclease V) beta subunit